MTDHQCSSCGGFCKKSGCERRDNIVPCKHWKAGITNLTSSDCPYCRNDELKSQMQGLSNEINDFVNTIQRLKGEHTVMINLLMEAINVIETVDGESAEECESLMNLKNKIHYAINGAIQGLV